MDKTVTRIVAHLKNALTQSGIKVDGIALFGASVSGNRNENTDLDLIIISPSFQDKDIFERAEMTTKPELDVIRTFNVPTEILNMSPDEYRHTLQRTKIVA